MDIQDLVLISVDDHVVPHFCGQFFGRVADKDLALAAVCAYNDWHIDERRLVPRPARPAVVIAS